MEFGKRFRQVRKEKHLTLKEASEIMGVSVAHVSAVERCEKAPFTPILIRTFLEKIDRIDLLDELVLLSFLSRNTITFHRENIRECDWKLIALFAKLVSGKWLTYKNIADIELCLEDIDSANEIVR